jgi:hypothetical protein
MITPMAYTLSSPAQIFRSSMFSLVTITYFGCNLTYTQANKWTLRRIDILTSMDLTTNPTSTQSELVIQANTLSYGTYEFTYQVSINTQNMIPLTSSISTYIQIMPTGLAVFALQNGISTLLIGFGQSQILNPSLYSFDFDMLAVMSGLKFKFYCVLSSLSTTHSNQIDLATYKSNPFYSSMNASQACFTSNGNQTF